MLLIIRLGGTESLFRAYVEIYLVVFRILGVLQFFHRFNTLGFERFDYCRCRIFGRLVYGLSAPSPVFESPESSGSAPASAPDERVRQNSDTKPSVRA
jgi:hypothetical protein